MLVSLNAGCGPARNDLTTQWPAHRRPVRMADKLDSHKTTEFLKVKNICTPEGDICSPNE